MARRWFEASGHWQTWKGWVDDSDHQFGEAADEHCYDGDERYPHGRDFLNLQQLSFEMAFDFADANERFCKFFASRNSGLSLKIIATRNVTCSFRLISHVLLHIHHV